MANQRHSPQGDSEESQAVRAESKNEPAPRLWKRRSPGELGNRSAIPTFHSHDDELPVTFLMSRRVLPSNILKWLDTGRQYFFVTTILMSFTFFRWS